MDSHFSQGRQTADTTENSGADRPTRGQFAGLITRHLRKHGYDVRRTADVYMSAMRRNEDHSYEVLLAFVRACADADKVTNKLAAASAHANGAAKDSNSRSGGAHVSSATHIVDSTPTPAPNTSNGGDHNGAATHSRNAAPVAGLSTPAPKVPDKPKAKPPVSKPLSAATKLANIAMAASDAKGLLYSVRLRDGRVIGECLPGELRTVKAANARDNYLIDRLLSHASNMDESKKIGEQVSDKHAKAYLADAAKAVFA